MSQSLSKLYVHLVFSTRGREPSLTDILRGGVHEHLATIFRGLGSFALEINSEPDHIHILFVLPRTMSLSEVVQKVKSRSSFLIKRLDESISDFAWQGGYGGFSVSASRIEGVRRYIRNQRAHHRTHTWKDEYRRWLREYEVEFDDRFVWD